MEFDANAHRNAGIQTPLATLSVLRDQLHLLVPLLTVGEGKPEMDSVLDAVRATTAHAQGLLAVAEPEALRSLRAGFAHADASEHNEARTALLGAYHRLSVLLQADTERRREAADEPTRPLRD